MFLHALSRGGTFLCDVTLLDDYSFISSSFILFPFSVLFPTK